MNWLQCYENPNMNNLVDHNGRTIWFDVREQNPVSKAVVENNSPVVTLDF